MPLVTKERTSAMSFNQVRTPTVKFHIGVIDIVNLTPFHTMAN
jgi:hypothetical protein